MPKHISPRFLAQVQVSIANRLRQCSDDIRRLSILAREDDCFGTILRNGRIRHRQRSRCAARNSKDRKSVVWGRSVSVRLDLGVGGIIKKKKEMNMQIKQ